MFQFLPIAALTLSLATIVKGHGFVHEVVVNGKSYPGYAPFTDPYASPAVQRIVRKVPDDGPVTDIHAASLACNVGGDKPAALVADAPAGSKVTFNWQNWPNDHLGPVSTYMTSCNGDCTKFNNPSGAQWFKVDAAGYDSSKKQWASDKLIQDGASWTSTIPASLAPGQYLIRHEIVALHSTGQPQFYPVCAQLKVTGNGNTKASDAQTVTIPGLYDSVKFPDIWADGFNKFSAPGPSVFASSGNSQQSAPAASSAAPASEPSATKPATPSSTANASPSGKASSSASSTASATPPSAPNASSTLVSAAPASSGKCRSRAKRHARHASLAKRHH